MTSNSTSTSTNQLNNVNNHIKSRNHTSTTILTKDFEKKNSPKKSIKSKEFSPQDLVHALEIEKDELLNHTMDLEQEIRSLTSQLKESYNTIQILQEGNSTKSEIGINQKNKSNLKSNKKIFKSQNSQENENNENNNNEENEEEKNYYNDNEDNIDNEDEDEDIDSMYRKIRSQSNRIRQLVHQLEEQKTFVKQVKEDNNHIKEKNVILKEIVENLRLELGSRPTVKQWKDKINEINELETQLRDIIVMRKESNEIQSWKKHLNTHERIQIDKKNYELKLWLLESLPKTVMKDVLQGVCRELELNDISNIIETIQKLKIVIKTIPRMEKFISIICNYIFERTIPLHTEGDPINRPVMEDVIPIIKQWWNNNEKLKYYKQFYENIFDLIKTVETELFNENIPIITPFQGDTILSSTSSNTPFQSQSFTSSELIKFQQINNEIINKIKSLIKFYQQIFIYSKNYQMAEKYISENPEILLHGIIEHILYLFNVNKLEGLIPKLNEVYLFTEEMSNFINTLRNLLKMKHVPDATVITEIYRIIQEHKINKNININENFDNNDDSK